MATPLSQLLRAVQEDEPGSVTVEVPDDWMQGRSLFGGLQVAIALRAMRGLVPDTPLRTLQTTFVAPVPAGRVGATARVLRSGKNATHVEARLADGATTTTIVIGVFGAPRSSVVAVMPTAPPVASGPPIDPGPARRAMPTFIQHFSARWLRGMPPFTGDTGCEHVVEVGIHDDGPATEGHVVAIADFIPPLALSHLQAPAPGSTLTWMMEFLTDALEDLPLAGWRVDARLVAARDGYTSQAVMVWGPGGVPVALSYQSMLVFG